MSTIMKEIPTIIKHDDILMSKVLSPYFENTTYLKKVDVHIASNPAEGSIVSGKGWFEIPTSCYIADTGHFNSVEFNICYNQIMYYVIAVSVKHKIIKAFNKWTLETYYEKQLPDILIVNFKSRFSKPLNQKRFYGEIDFIDIKYKKSNSLLFIKTLCRYADEPGRFNCEGEVDLAIVEADVL